MCTSPLKAFIVPVFSRSRDPTRKSTYVYQKNEYVIASFKAHHIEKVNNHWNKAYSEIISPYATDVIDEYIEIGCGKCEQCLLARSRMWANRCMLELLDHDPSECWFLTLTYDAEHLPMRVFEDYTEFNSLVKSDLQKFWKRLRKSLFSREELHNLRYFACGEYGSTTFRPHYHAIVYSLPLHDLEFWSKSKTGNPLFTSKYLTDVWQQGIVTVSPVSWETCAYTARYVMKKAKGYDKEYMTDLGLTPEFVVMSRHPGIAANYYEKFKDKIYKFDEIVLDNGNKIKPPRYYDGKFETDDPEKYKQIKYNRIESAQRNKEMKLSKTDLSYEEYLKVEQAKTEAKVKLLRREL